MKKNNLPTWFDGEIYEEGDTVVNPFSEKEYFLTGEELSMYDYIMGATITAEMGIFNTEHHIKELRQGLDWFRDLLLPDVVNILPIIVEPVRQNQGRVAILDGRLRARSWGNILFKALQPWTPIDRLLPH